MHAHKEKNIWILLIFYYMIDKMENKKYQLIVTEKEMRGQIQIEMVIA